MQNPAPLGIGLVPGGVLERGNDRITFAGYAQRVSQAVELDEEFRVAHDRSVGPSKPALGD